MPSAPGETFWRLTTTWIQASRMYSPRRCRFRTPLSVDDRRLSMFIERRLSTLLEILEHRGSRTLFASRDVGTLGTGPVSQRGPRALSVCSPGLRPRPRPAGWLEDLF